MWFDIQACTIMLGSVLVLIFENRIFRFWCPRNEHLGNTTKSNIISHGQKTRPSQCTLGFALLARKIFTAFATTMLHVSMISNNRESCHASNTSPPPLRCSWNTRISRNGISGTSGNSNSIHHLRWTHLYQRLHRHLLRVILHESDGHFDDPPSRLKTFCPHSCPLCAPYVCSWRAS